MPGMLRCSAWGAGILGLALAIVFGPVFAGYVFAAAAFGLIGVLLVQQAAHAIDDWRLDHPWKPRHPQPRRG